MPLRIIIVWHELRNTLPAGFDVARYRAPYVCYRHYRTIRNTNLVSIQTLPAWFGHKLNVSFTAVVRSPFVRPYRQGWMLYWNTTNNHHVVRRSASSPPTWRDIDIIERYKPRQTLRAEAGWSLNSTIRSYFEILMSWPRGQGWMEQVFNVPNVGLSLYTTSPPQCNEHEPI